MREFRCSQPETKQMLKTEVVVTVSWLTKHLAFFTIWYNILSINFFITCQCKKKQVKLKQKSN